VEMLRRAMEGDITPVTKMVREGMFAVVHLGLEVSSWLCGGLMHEVLRIEPAPEPPLGWEGPYLEAVETTDDFIKWIDLESAIHGRLNRGQESCSSDGRLVRNAYRLVMELGLTGMPLEPIGPFTLNAELTVLRNLRRLCRELRGDQPTGRENASDADPAEACPPEGIVPDSGQGEAEQAEDASDSRLSPSRLKAYGQFCWAIRENAALDGATDREVYDWLGEQCKEETLPSFAAWNRYLREARRAHGTSKHTPRAGRETGRNIVRPDEI
jgi:hypothetical protein